jgi:demethylmenaquinone methyltransferase/2-methoxy-6-polyprenyl-1,4-benzoquinol methylase
VTLERDTLREAGAIRRMFDGIAPRYDFLNHLLSLNRDRAWRDRVVALSAADGPVLDVCAGTGDLTLEYAARGGLAVGADFSEPMLRLGRAKCAREGRRAEFVVADTLRLPFPDGLFGTVSAAFGVRNLADLRAGLEEMARVVKPGGEVVILEFTTPGNPVLRAAYLLYFLIVLPIVGNLLSGSRDGAYSYLPRSVLRFPGRARLAGILAGIGLRDVRVVDLSLGIVNVLVGRKPGPGEAR